MAKAALNSTVGGLAGFASTQWGALLVAAADDGKGDRSAQTAWEFLYRTYCDPVYAFIRRSGHPRQAAQDLTQDFFLHLVKTDTMRHADPSKGRFRSFLLGALRYFLVDVSRSEGAKKRGGGYSFVPLDDPESAECNYQLAAPAGQTPERLFEARWAAALVAEAFTRLREEMVAIGKNRLFEALKDYVAGAEESSYRETARALELSLPALKSAIHRLRHRYRALLREEIARTVADPGEIDAEMRHLCAVLRGS